MSPQTLPPPQELDPSAPGTIIRTALALESIATIGIGAYYTIFPRHYLLTNMGTSAAQATTTAVQIVQQFGAVNVLIGATVGIFISNSKRSVEARQTLYVVLLVFELCYVPLLMWQAFMMEGGMPRKAILDGAKVFVPFVVWRVFTLGWRREWFGRFVEGRKRE
jgi:hypothetical protein